MADALGVTSVGVLHPGAMGAALAATCTAEALWCSAGRSLESRDRAAVAGLVDVGTLEALVARVDVMVSVCPPESAVAVADAVAELGFSGTYVDANAIAPGTARSISGRFERFVDGGIVGPPPRTAGTTRLYLAGDAATDVAALWEAPLDVRVVAGDPGAASALKMAYAMWTKISAALLLDVRALARIEGVEEALLAEWALSQPEATGRSESTAPGVGPKAWRFAGEMDQMAITARDAGLPPGFAEAAAEIYRRLAVLQTVDAPTLEDALTRLLKPAP